MGEAQVRMELEQQAAETPCKAPIAPALGLFWTGVEDTIE